MKTRQLVDWRAAVIAGFVSGIAFLALAMLLTAYYVGSPWVITRLAASLLLGKGALPPPATFTAGTFVAGLVAHFTLSVAFSCLIAFVLHRWGMVVGIIGGAVFGIALYFINFNTFAHLFPWFFFMKSWIMTLSHVAFGALAGGVYEALEVERFVAASD